MIGLGMEESDEATPELVRLLESVSWGTRGPRYRTLDVAASLSRLPSTRYWQLRRADELVGCYGFLRKTVRVGGVSCDAVYRCALAVHGPAQGQRLGRHLVQEGHRRWLDGQAGPRVVYGFIESDNDASLVLSRRAGYRDVGSLRVVAFSRIRPKRDPRHEPLDAAGAPEVRALLERAYAHYQLVDFDASFRADEYHVLRERGRVVAGVQVVPKHWSFEHLPGATGRLALAALPRAPLLRRVFDPRDLRFLWLGSFYVPPGAERQAFALIESAMAAHHVGAALAYFDPRDDLWARMARVGRFGLLHRMGLGGELRVTAGVRDAPESVMRALQRGPLFPSPLDCQ